MERFWSKVLKTDGCWAWYGHRMRDGYGHFSKSGGGGSRGGQKMILAHRQAFLLENGHLPAVVRHTCDNRGCVNPAHLVPGTHADNMRDMTDRGRQARGSTHAAAKLTEDTVHWLRATHLPQRTAAEWAGVSPSLVEKIRSRKRWKHI
jgi:hypothetical protein